MQIKRWIFQFIVAQKTKKFFFFSTTSSLQLLRPFAPPYCLRSFHSTENTQIDKLEGFSNSTCLLSFYTFEIVERDNHRSGKTCQRRPNNSNSCIACVIYQVKMKKIKPRSSPRCVYYGSTCGPRAAGLTSLEMLNYTDILQAANVTWVEVS